MTFGWASGLLRHPGATRRATFLELLFDLVFVLALALVSQTLVDDFSPRGVLHAAVALLAIWWIWIMTTLVASFYNSESPALQAITVVSMLGASLMATTIPTAFGDRGLVFAGAYVTIHLGRTAFFASVLPASEARARAVRVMCWFAVSAVPWLIGAVVTGPARAALWILALVVDYSALAFGYPTPRWREVPKQQFAPTAEHLAERYHQFFAIALGDIILVGGLLFSHQEQSLVRIGAFLSAFTSALLFWRLYAHCAGDLLHRAIAVSPTPGRFTQSAPYTHLLMVAGVVATAASAKLVIDHPHADTPWSEVALILGGPVIFLVGRARFDHEVFGRIARSLLVGLAVLIALAPAMRPLPHLLIAVIGNLVLAGIAIFDAVTRRRADHVPPDPPL